MEQRHLEEWMCGSALIMLDVGTSSNYVGTTLPAPIVVGRLDRNVDRLDLLLNFDSLSVDEIKISEVLPY